MKECSDVILFRRVLVKHLLSFCYLIAKIWTKGKMKTGCFEVEMKENEML